MSQLPSQARRQPRTGWSAAGCHLLPLRTAHLRPIPSIEQERRPPMPTSSNMGTPGRSTASPKGQALASGMVLAQTGTLIPTLSRLAGPVRDECHLLRWTGETGGT